MVSFYTYIVLVLLLFTHWNIFLLIHYDSENGTNKKIDIIVILTSDLFSYKTMHHIDYTITFYFCINREMVTWYQKHRLWICRTNLMIWYLKTTNSACTILWMSFSDATSTPVLLRTKMRKEGRKTNREIRDNDCIIKLQLTNVHDNPKSSGVTNGERSDTLVTWYRGSSSCIISQTIGRNKTTAMVTKLAIKNYMMNKIKFSLKIKRRWASSI